MDKIQIYTNAKKDKYKKSNYKHTKIQISQPGESWKSIRFNLSWLDPSFIFIIVSKYKNFKHKKIELLYVSGLMNRIINLSLIFAHSCFLSLLSPLKCHLNTEKQSIPKIHILPSCMCVCMEVVGVWGGVESQLVRGKRTGLRSSPTMRCVPHFGFLNLAYGTFSFL